MTSKEIKVGNITQCPNCHSDTFDSQLESTVCRTCKEEYPLFYNAPFFLKKGNEIREGFLKFLDNYRKTGKKKGFRFPSPRIWTKNSIACVAKALKETNPDSKSKVVVCMGSGEEEEYKKLFSNYNDIIRIGLAHNGNVDIFGDAMDFPVKDNSVDLIVSSSVLEHVINPEKCVNEIFRILKPGGKIYAEIPFMRTFHMAPIDYQRYTYEGIEQLFKRHGFEMEKKGVCSGPFNAIVLFNIDVLKMFLPNSLLFLVKIAAWIMQPIKYLDRLVEGVNRTKNVACNFYYLGQKPLT